MGVSTTHPILSMWILIYSFDTYYVWAGCAMNYLFLNRNFALNSRKLLKRWCGKVLSISERKVVLVAILEGKSMPFNMAANTNISLKCVSSQISGVRWYFLCPPSIFGISKIPTHCLKETLVTWPLSASGLWQQQQQQQHRIDFKVKKLFWFLKNPCFFSIIVHWIPFFTNVFTSVFKVAWLDFLGLIPPNFEHQLRRHE